MHKYHAKPQVIDGYRFPSAAEARRYQQLKLLLAAGEIDEFRVHTRWPLVVNGHPCGVYESDFDYLNPWGTRIVEDVKGVLTDVYRLKKKLMRAIYQIDIVEVFA